MQSPLCTQSFPLHTAYHIAHKYRKNNTPVTTIITLHRCIFNRIVRNLFLLCIPLFFVSKVSAACFSDTSWVSQPLANKNSSLEPQIKTVSEECLSAAVFYISKSDTQHDIDQFVKLLTNWSLSNTVTSSLLFAAYSNPVAHKNASLWSTVFTLWNSANRSIFSEVHRLVNDGDMFTADTLLQILDSENKIGNPELILWTKVKVVTKAYSGIAPIYCRILSQNAAGYKDSMTLQRIQSYTLGQCAQHINEAGKEQAQSILNDFSKCALSLPAIDAEQLKDWLAQQYSRYELFDNELAILSTKHPSDPRQSTSSILTDCARERFINKNFVHSLRAAKAGYHLAQTSESKSDASTLIYQSFLALGLSDSALVWLKRADITSEKRLIEAIRLYQQSGQLQQAGEFIDKLGASITKDTLQIRQELYAQRFPQAILLLNKSAAIKRSKNDRLLWNVRTNLFSGNVENTFKQLDTLPEPATFKQAAELLSYKYWLARLQECPDALEAWAPIEYNIYMGNPQKCVRYIENDRIAPDCRQKLALLVSRALYEKKEVSEALKILEKFDEKSVSSEFLYFKASYHFNLGKHDLSKKILERILLDFPDDIYSGKARLFLSEITDQR